MLFPQKINTSAKGPKWARMRQQTWHKWMDEFVCYVSVEIFLMYPDEPLTSETDALNKNVVQYRGEVGLSQHPSWMKCLTWTLFLYTLEFSSYRLKHCHSRPIFIPLAFLCYPSKRSNFDPIFIHIGFLILSFKTLEFWPFFGTYWNSYLIISRTGILALFL